MDYSKWKKILIILTIINLIWIFYNRVFASTSDYLTNTTTFNTVTQDVTLGNSNYGGTITFQNIPSFIFEYSNVLLTMYVNEYNLNNKTVLFLFSNNKIFVDSNGIIRGENNKDYYYRQASAPYTPIDYGSLTLSNFTLINGNRTFWSGYLSSDTNYSYSALQGVIYDYDNQDTIIKDNNPVNNPEFIQPDSTIQSLDFDSILIEPNDYGINDYLYFKVLEITNVVENPNDVSQNIYYFNDLTFAINKSTKYFKEILDTQIYYYEIPFAALKLKKDSSYYFILTDTDTIINNYIGEITEDSSFYDIILADTTNIVTTQDEILNNLNNNYPNENTNSTINNGVPNSSNNFFNTQINEDITESGFNGIFSKIYNIIHRQTSSDENLNPIEITIPFVNYTFTLNHEPIYNWLNSTTAGTSFITLLHTVYFFIVSWYIVNDIRKLIEHLKDGSITTHTDTNIKAEML